MSRKHSIFILLLIILFTGKLFSDNSLIGTTANNYLKILLPAEPAGMGNAYVALADDIHSVAYNPAGAAKSMFSEISATHAMWFEQVLYDNINYMVPLSAGTFAFSLNYLHMTPMDRTIASATPSGYDTLYRFSPYSLAGTVTYAVEFTDNVFVGASLSVQNFTIDPESDSGSSLSVIGDLGLIYDMDFVKGLSAGISFRDLGFPSSFAAEEYMQPINMRAGLGYASSMFSVEADVEIINDNDINFFAGGSFTLEEMVTLRAGYRAGVINQPTFGAGLAYNNFFVDYAFIPFWEEDLGLTHRVTLTYKFGSPEALIKAEPKVFSPNGDRVYDYTFIRPELKNENKIKAMTMKVFNSFNEPVRTAAVRSASKIFWNGVTDFRTVAPDGEYYAALDVDYGGGIKSRSNLEKVEVDNTPPAIKVDARPRKVRPGRIDTLVAPVRFTPRVFDLHGTGKWSLVIKGPDNKIFRTFAGTGEPMPIVWDGTDNTGMNSVQTGSVYTYTMYAKDTVGNLGKSRTEKVNVLLREVIITLDADTLFDPGKADVKISVYKDLEKIAERIKGYSKKSVKIVGHTDNRPMRFGQYRDNQELSEYRARAVAKFFVELFGIDSDIFSTEGRGASQPVATNDTPEGRKKNRRVTIHLKASTWE